MIFVFLFSIKLISAQEGCYLYPDSQLYCFSLENQDALEDCMSHDDCRLSEVFFPDQDCQDQTTFPVCEEVFCKSTCDYTFLGKCLGGKITPGQEQLWCSPGCCRFHSTPPFCSFQQTKWLCEVEARNKAAPQFNFDPSLTQAACQAYCSQTPPQTITQNLPMEPVSPPPSLPVVEVKTPSSFTPPTTATSPSTPSQPAPSPTKTTPPSEETLEVEEKTSFPILKLLFFLLLLIALFFWLYHKNKSKKEISSITKKRIPFFTSRKRIAQRREKLRKLIEERNKKRREQERAELFSLFGFGEITKKKPSYLDLLAKVIKTHELRKSFWLKQPSSSKKDAFAQVETLITDLKKGKKKITELTETQAKDIFERLKQILEK